LIKNFKIKKDYKVRLDKYLKVLFTSLTQSFIEKNIRKKNILINNTRTKSNYIVSLNDNLTILNFNDKLYKNKINYKKNYKVPNNLISKFNDCILFENSNFIVLDKWSNISTQGGSKINISIDHIIKNINTNFRLVHRLDKETSGLLLIAKNLKYARILTLLFKEKKIGKLYIALCEGKPKIEQSQVDLDIQNKKQKFEKSLTTYKVIKYKNGISQILYVPKTGKTHQLRIVSKNLGCPIIGDNKYNIRSKYTKENLMLHAFGLKFIIDSKIFSFASKLPDYVIKFNKKNKMIPINNLNKYLDIF